MRTGMIMISPWCPDNADCKWLCNSFLSEWLGWAHFNEGRLAGWVGNGLACSFDIVGAPVRLTWCSLQLCHQTAPPCSKCSSKAGILTRTGCQVNGNFCDSDKKCKQILVPIGERSPRKKLVVEVEMHVFVNSERDNWMHACVGWTNMTEITREIVLPKEVEILLICPIHLITIHPSE